MSVEHGFKEVRRNCDLSLVYHIRERGERREMEGDGEGWMEGGKRAVASRICYS